MNDAVAVGEKLLSLLDQSARSSTYKPALLLALVDRAQDVGEDDRLPVRALAERVTELYWPQTLAYPTTGAVLSQNQAGGQAQIVSAIVRFRAEHNATMRALPESLRRASAWDRLVDRVEATLAEWPIPRLQRPYAPFLYDFAWPWAEGGGWSLAKYRATSRSIQLRKGIAESLTALGPLLRPFITRWWTDKAAQLNPEVEAARSVLEFEQFLFGRDRIALERVAEGLLDLQGGACFYCSTRVGRDREIDHFIPWSYSGDDGIDNLVAACHRCNNGKRAALPGGRHVTDLLTRNHRWDSDLDALATERRWPRHAQRSARITRNAYVRSPPARPLWVRMPVGALSAGPGPHRAELLRLFG
jgi:5-methylcytosine-specific restriction endonuclease McrA